MEIDYTPNNTFIFCYVRMNPPTPGHLALIDAMINTAADLNTEKIFIITSSTMDGKNPLPCSDKTIPKTVNAEDLFGETSFVYKSPILKDMITKSKDNLAAKESDPEKRERISNLNVIIKCSQGSPFGTFRQIIGEYFASITDLNIYFFAGRDRANFLDTVINVYSDFEENKNIYSVNGEILGRAGMGTLKSTGIGERDISTIQVSEYSASFVRNLVNHFKKNPNSISKKDTMIPKTPEEIERDREVFNFIYRPYLSEENISKLYETILDGIKLKQPSSKDENENPPTDYFTDEMNPDKPGYHMKKINRKTGQPILPIINIKKQTQIIDDSAASAKGGKKNKRKTKKTRKTKKIRKTRKSNRKSNRKY